ncbi:MAG: nickel pincer cofactor biosynthesis protein LarC [Archaeoglobales archaeon]|nr:nickel pincer cofactor biosynthesis protein LarC [Archaeoglobales archaeon]
MKIAIFDAFNGASGNMILASLLEISISEEDLRRIIKSLGLKIDFEIKKVEKKGIQANYIDVKEEIVERDFEEVVKILKSSDLDDAVKKDSINIFSMLFNAEKNIHGDCSFHEVGGDDAIFDVVSAVLGIRRLIVEGYRFYATTIRVGSGFTSFSHGKYPVPAPATLEILKNSELEICFGGDLELLTPTGASILSYYCKKLPKIPFTVKNVSYGAGKYETEVPNVLRLILGETTQADSVVLLETNIDDASGEFIGYAAENLRKLSGVLDVWIVPAYGKKSRPVFEIKVLTKEGFAEEAAKKLMELTGTLGVRIISINHRMVAEREIRTAKINFKGKNYEVRYKISPTRCKLEFEDLCKIAEEMNTPIFEVYKIITREVYNADPER